MLDSVQRDGCGGISGIDNMWNSFQVRVVHVIIIFVVYLEGAVLRRQYPGNQIGVREIDTAALV